MALNIKKGKSVTKKAVQTATTVEHSKTGADVVKEEILAMAEVPPVHAMVGITASRTINLGEYNNVKMGVSIYHPCAPTEKAIEACYQFCMGWVDDHMKALCEEHDPVTTDAD